MDNTQVPNAADYLESNGSDISVLGNQELTNIYNQAKKAIGDELQTNLYNATQGRRNAFRKLNNKANYYHSMFSGMPTGMQMQYDESTYLPGIKSAVTTALAKQRQNQQAWDQQVEYINNLNAQADYYNNLANSLSGYAQG